MEIKSILNEKTIMLSLESADKLDAIRQMAGVFYEAGKIKDEKVFVDAVLEREKQCSTGVGMGLAIPHGKSDTVTEAGLLFARSKNGLEFDSMDGKLAHLIFMIAVPETANELHLQILSGLSRKLMHEGLRKELMAAGTKEEIINILMREE